MVGWTVAVFFVIFVVCLATMKWVLKTLGYFIDMGKKGSGSFYFMAEVFALLMYYIFYRNLFADVEDLWAFGILQLVHVANEWISYPFRASRFYYDMSVRLQARSDTLTKVL